MAAMRIRPVDRPLPRPCLAAPLSRSTRVKSSTTPAPEHPAALGTPGAGTRLRKRVEKPTRQRAEEGTERVSRANRLAEVIIPGVERSALAWCSAA